MRIRCLLLLLAAPLAQAEPDVVVATASNFSWTASELADRFYGKTGIVVTIASASTGTLYASIVNGAPYDIFLAADQARPQRLEEAGYIADDGRFTYAIGVLVIWSTMHDDCEAALVDPDAGRVALANPSIAPYGVAAMEYLESQGVRDEVEDRLVYGKSNTQAAQFIATGNAAVGLIAKSVLEYRLAPQGRCTTIVPQDTYTPIRQDAALLAGASDNHDARRFFEFLQSDEARTLIAESGYGVVD